MYDSDLSIASSVSEPITGYALGTKAYGLVEVLVDYPGIQALYYNVPERLSIQVGDILTVPLRDEIIGGIAVRFTYRLPE